MFSSTCDEVVKVADRLVGQLRRLDYLVDLHRSEASFARLTVSTGRYRRTVLIVELGRDHQLFDSVRSSLGPSLSIPELAANKVLAAFGRREPRDLVDLAVLADVTSLRQAVIDGRRKDPGLIRDPFVEMVGRTMRVRDDLWPKESDPDAVREFAGRVLLDPGLFG